MATPDPLPIRTVVVDDDFMVARLHSSTVTRLDGFEVVGVASTGAQALAVVKDKRPDLVLLDVYLPDLTGLEVLRRLRGLGADCDVIVISAARDLDSLRQAMQSGVYQYLVKPFELDELRRRLAEYALHRARIRGQDPDTTVEQEEADRLFRAGPAGRGRTSLPKGISAETVALVSAALAGAGDEGMSATECGEAVGIARSSARRYLEHLVDTGAAAVRHRYGSAGRPERRYQSAAQ
ncbi:response regulator [Knoellia sp. LjRoot47]|uniref:response regulator n=1 Tax=Knoellia sp. LjRoot47 TaxID=3342330 RepID=UPI003ECF22A4